MMDPAQLAWAGQDPQQFAEWLDAVTEPRFMTALATMALDAQTYPETLSRVFDPAKARNWTEFIDPKLFMRWMAASMDPRFSQALLNRFANPQKYLRWMAYPAAAAAQLANPVMPSSGLGAMPPGEGRALAGAPSAQEWLKLQTLDPKANPWLTQSASYRY